MKINIYKIKREYIFLAIIILIALFFRFYNFPFRYGLGDETVRDAVIGIEGARELQFPLTGAFSSAGAFTFGPWFYYQLILFHLFFPSLYSSWIYLSIGSVSCVFVLYKIGKLLEGEILGLLLAFFASLSPALIIAGTHLTTQNMTNIFALLAVWIFLKIALKNVTYWWYIFLGIILGIGVNLHYQMAGLFILPIVLIIYKKQILYFFLSIVGVVVTFLPLLFFDLNNHWFTFRNMLYYLQHGKETMYVPNRWLFYLRDFWPAVWGDVLGVPQIIAAAIIISFVCVVAWQIRKKTLPVYMILLLAAFLFNFILLRYYWGPRFFGYLNFLRPFVFIFTGYVLVFIYNTKRIRHIFYLVVLVLAAMIFPKALEMLPKDPLTLLMYDKLSIFERKFPNQKLQIYTCSNDTKNNNTIIHSALFLLDYKHKLSVNGLPIGIMPTGNTCGYVLQYKAKDKNAYILLKSRLSDNLINLSDTKRDELTNFGWRLVTFNSIYETTVRWWFIERP
ncbi:MAG: glycosyltransferase family 39 protein [Candidatus Levyibacteriota bacterium]|nr:MAG: glycosyltransferase family 39 protein [Candidatus Levybacteria bacterium]